MRGGFQGGPIVRTTVETFWIVFVAPSFYHLMSLSAVECTQHPRFCAGSVDRPGEPSQLDCPHAVDDITDAITTCPHVAQLSVKSFPFLFSNSSHVAVRDLISPFEPLRSLVEPLQVAIDNGAKKALIPIENKRNFFDVSADVLENVDPIFFGDLRTAAFKSVGLG